MHIPTKAGVGPTMLKAEEPKAPQRTPATFAVAKPIMGGIPEAIANPIIIGRASKATEKAGSAFFITAF